MNPEQREKSANAAALEIRPAGGEAERARALEITLSAYEEYSRVLRPEYWQSYREHIIETLGEPGSAEQWLAVIDGEIVGTLLFYPPGTAFEDEEAGAGSDECPEVRLLAVAPQGRGRGVGRRLMDASLQRARTDGHPGLVLHSMDMMKAARSLYESLGFVRAPELDFQPAQEWFVEGFKLEF